MFTFNCDNLINEGKDIINYLQITSNLLFLLHEEKNNPAAFLLPDQ